MLKQLILENWKSFRYAQLPLDPLTVLIGTNASGKSNVAEALELLKRIVRGEDIEVALEGNKTLSSIRGGVEWAALKPENQFILKLIVQGEDDKTDYFYSITVQTKPDVHIVQESLEIQKISSNFQSNNETLINNILLSNKSYLSEVNHLFAQGKKKHDKLKLAINKLNNDNQELLKNFNALKENLTNNEAKAEIIIEEIKNVKNQTNKMIEIIYENDNNFDLLSNYLKVMNIIINKISSIFILNPIPSTMRDYSRLSDILESDGSNIAGVLAALDNEQKAEVESTLSAYIKDFPEGDIKTVFAEPIGRLKTDAMLYCEEEWKPGEMTLIDARSMSDGTLRFLAILTALLTRPEGSQLVIEEIDNGLHPSRAELLVRILREVGSKRKIDILITTHNPALLDALGPEIVPFVVVAHRNKETGESKLTLLEDIENLPLLLASGTLGKLATKGAIEKSLSDNK
ncbi:ATPase-like protein [Nostoc commune NIES-4072]|uniref:ATPase-like protein n=1 Tax=Nostoc commune NIES-4072 TaxID=2005467 RepID=A0A2R5FNV4_NOSCO|nr:ATP-binding protein [Nostoc commune]BBD65372.1 ATPase-like protein [Nostoc commune HK-02]GBG17304.1 ATPase-like protein [Nostoc commune NIES-4072]